MDFRGSHATEFFKKMVSFVGMLEKLLKYCENVCMRYYKARKILENLQENKEIILEKFLETFEEILEMERFWYNFWNISGEFCKCVVEKNWNTWLTFR